MQFEVPCKNRLLSIKERAGQFWQVRVVYIFAFVPSLHVVSATCDFCFMPMEIAMFTNLIIIIFNLVTVVYTFAFVPSLHVFSAKCNFCLMPVETAMFTNLII